MAQKIVFNFVRDDGTGFSVEARPLTGQTFDAFAELMDRHADAAASLLSNYPDLIRSGELDGPERAEWMKGKLVELSRQGRAHEAERRALVRKQAIEVVRFACTDSPTERTATTVLADGYLEQYDAGAVREFADKFRGLFAAVCA